MKMFVICNQPHGESTPVFRSKPIEDIAFPDGDGCGNCSLMGAWEKRCIEMNKEYRTHNHWIEIITN